MAESDPAISRRRFVRLGVFGAGVCGAAGAAGWLATRPDDAAESRAGTRLDYDLRKLADVDPALVRFAPGDVIARDLHAARDMVAGGGAVHIAVGQTVVRHANGGSVESTIELMEEPLCLCALGDGRVLVGFVDHVETFDAGGRNLATWPALPGRPRLTSIAARDGIVAAADAGNRTVWRLAPDGDVVGRIDDGFVIPSPYFDVAFDRDGLLWVANTGRHRLEAYDAQDRLVRTWGVASMAAGGFSGCCNPCHFTLLPDGRFITAEKGLNRIAVHGADGAFIGFVADHRALGAPVARLSCDLNDPANAPPIPAAADDGNVLVLCPSTGELRAFVPA